MTKKVNVFLILFIFLFGFAGGAYLKHIKDASIILNLNKQIQSLKSDKDYDNMMLDIYRDKLFGNSDSLQ